MVISSLADTVLRQIETVQDTVSQTLFEPSLRIGVTGLARAGKTVFLTSLVANLLDRGRMPHLQAAAEGRIEAVYLQPQPDDTVPRFDFEAHLGRLKAPSPSWPASTRAVSELRLSVRVRRAGLLAGLQGPRVLHLDFVDYPGEWLLDLGLLDKSYEDWSLSVFERLKNRSEASDFKSYIDTIDVGASLEETTAQALAKSFTAYLLAARGAGYYDCTPGRFLLPGELEGSPVLTFAPLPGSGKGRRGSLRREMARRFDAYKTQVVRPFFHAHFARIDRQVVLVDALGAISNGPAAVEDMRQAMVDILGAFRPGRNAFLTQLLQGRRVEKILFAATKADHLHHRQHGRLTAIMEAMVRDATDRARFAGTATEAMAIASLRATTEETVRHESKPLDVVRGRLLEDGRHAAFHPGSLPEDPSQLLGAARDGAPKWLDADYRAMKFAPARLELKPGDGPPHIRLDKAAQFLLGDRV
ncbi:MAG: YcjX family protein [Pseudomonadota bacterium]